MGVMKYYKGQHVIALTPKILEDHQKLMAKQVLKIDPRCLHWTPLPSTSKKLYK